MVVLTLQKLLDLTKPKFYQRTIVYLDFNMKLIKVLILTTNPFLT